MHTLIARLLVEEDGGEVLEYALLASLVIIVGYGALLSLQNQLESSYRGWLGAVDRCADTPAPGGRC
jgi:Flp pilus assembly pilin Flp